MRENRKTINRDLKRRRVRAKIFGTPDRPRLSVFRSLRGIEAQLIDDTKGQTLIRASSKEAKNKGSKTDIATEVGKLIAEKAKEAGIKSVVFDRKHYKYHGRIRALAESAREGGLIF